MGAWSHPVLLLHIAGVTIADLAARTGVSQQTLKLYCRGAHTPPQRFFDAIEELAGEETAAAIRDHLEAAA